METMEMLSAIESIAKQNKLDVNKKFNSDYIGCKGFYSDAQEVANAAIKKMLAYCEMGINGGFTKEIKSAVYDLSKIVVGLTAVKNGEAKKIESYKGQVDKMLISSKKGNQATHDPREDISSYITTTIGAIDSVIKNKGLFGDSVDAQLGNLEALKAKLELLQSKIGDVHNVTSKQAADKARAITKELLNVRLELSRLFVSADVVARVDDALRLADEWAALTAATDKKNLAKKDDFPTYVEDNISALAGSDQIFDKIELFRKRFSEAEARIVNPASVQKAQSRLSEINVELVQIAQAQKELVIEFQNTGDRAKAERMATEYKNKKLKLEKEQQDLQKQINLHSKTNAARKQIVERFKSGVYEPIMSDMQDDPMQLCVTVTLMDLGSILSMLGGSFTQNDVDKATRTLLAARTQAKRKLEELIRASRVFMDTDELLQQSEEDMLQKLGLDDEELVSQEQTQQSSDLDELLAAFSDTTPQQNETKQTTKQTIPLTDDDK